MIRKILILGFVFSLSSCFEKKNLIKNKTEDSSMLLKKIIQDIKLKVTKVAYRLPEHEVITLDNGLQVIFMKDNLPYISFQLRLNAGRRFDSIAGESKVVASLLDKGTTSLSREDILNTLDRLGAFFSGSSTQEFSWLHASGLAKNDTALMNLFWELLTEPLFLESEWSKEKKILLTGLKNLPNSPDKFLQKVFNNFVYNNTFYKTETRQALQNLNRKDIAQFYNQYYQPELASLVVLGQYTEELKKNVIQKFSNWKTKNTKKKTFIKNQTTFNSPITLIHKADSVQANVIIGMPVNSSDYPYGSEAYIAERINAKLANFSLGGGGFNSRLLERVRKKEGLTYGIYSYFSFLKNLATFKIISSTNQGSLGKLLKVTFEEITNFYNNGISQAELDFSKLYYSNILFRSLEKKETLMNSFLELSGLGTEPVDYFENFVNRVQKADLITINKTIKKYFNPKNMKIFVLANKNSQGGEANPKNKGKLTIVEQLENFSEEFSSHKGIDIKNYKDISY